MFQTSDGRWQEPKAASVDGTGTLVPQTASQEKRPSYIHAVKRRYGGSLKYLIDPLSVGVHCHTLHIQEHAVHNRDTMMTINTTDITIETTIQYRRNFKPTLLN